VSATGRNVTRELQEEHLRILCGGKQPAGGLLAAENEESYFLLFSIRKKYEEMTKKYGKIMKKNFYFSD
jgi:hypothetical protein